jgi:8-oxo-dGTP pyrophosphatase MutT (NUDIX family)
MGEPIRSASTVVLWRQGLAEPEVLMGQRGAAAVFMPSKYVFPGGAIDDADHEATLTGMLSARCESRLASHCAQDAPSHSALAAAAQRELAEETGLHLSVLAPDQPPMRFIFRAITPPGRSRRFDARFFLVNAKAVLGDPDDFSDASDELAHLHWIGLGAARSLDLPFITEVVIAEVENLLRGGDQPGVPFFDNSTDVPTFRRIV